MPEHSERKRMVSKAQEKLLAADNGDGESEGVN
jgi:hypothetical protein